MAEPASGTAASVGLLALLVGAFGSVAADVMMVVLAAIAGCYVSLSSVKIDNVFQVIKYLLLSIIVSLVLSWVLAGMLEAFLSSYLNGWHSPYTPSMLAMGIGFMNNRIAPVVNQVFGFLFGKIGVKF